MVGFSVAHSVFMSVVKLNSVAGFHCHTIIKTIQPIKSRIKEIKEEEFSNSLAKIQVCEMFRAEDIRRNVFLKLLRLRMETPCLFPSKRTQVTL